MTTTVIDSNLSVTCPMWDSSRLQSCIVHPGCGAFHRAHQALCTHRLLETTDSDQGICEVNLIPGNDCILIRNLHKQQLLYTVAKKDADNTVLEVIGSIKETLHPEFDDYDGTSQAMAHPQTTTASLTAMGKGYCTDAASSQLDLNNPLIKYGLASPAMLKSAIGYIIQTLHLRCEQGLMAFTVMSCNNMREDGHVVEAAVLSLAQVCNPQLAQWIETNATFPYTMIGRIVPAATPKVLQEVASQLSVHDPRTIVCEPFRQWVIGGNFVNDRLNWNEVGAQLTTDVVSSRMMKLRMLDSDHSFLAYLGYLGDYETIADATTNPTYRKTAFVLIMQEQAPTLSMPEGTGLSVYTTLLIERFSNPSLHHRTWRIATDDSQKPPQCLLDPVHLHLQDGSGWHHLALGIAGWMRYTYDMDEQRRVIDVVGSVQAESRRINQQFQGAGRVTALLRLSGIFGRDLAEDTDPVETIIAEYQQLRKYGVRECIATLSADA